MAGLLSECGGAQHARRDTVLRACRPILQSTALDRRPLRLDGARPAASLSCDAKWPPKMVATRAAHIESTRSRTALRQRSAARHFMNSHRAGESPGAAADVRQNHRK